VKNSRRLALKVKAMRDGRVMLNCACGPTSHPEWNNIDFFAYARLKQHPFLIHLLDRLGFISEVRIERLSTIDPGIVFWDLRKGIPYDDQIFDVVYHSHFLEHLERDSALWFMKECYRVLKPNGSLRVVVPDLELLVKRYMSTLSQLSLPGYEKDNDIFAGHVQNVDHLIGQMVVLMKLGTEEQKRLVRWTERLVRGDGKESRELGRHRWMYDRFTLKDLLGSVGFTDVRVEESQTSRVEGWRSFNLDTTEDGTLRKWDSLFIEGTRPAD